MLNCWEPFESFRLADENPESFLHGVPAQKIKRAMTKFYCRLYSVQRLQPEYLSIGLSFTIAHRVLLKSSLIVSERYQEKIHEYRRGDHFVMFSSNHMNHLNQVMSCWPLDEQIAAGANPVIDPKYAVIAVDDIILQVGLVQSMSNKLDFSVVGNYHTFDQDMTRNAGSILNL
ncbi:hypothetical protein [Parasitella parasitica]|uniref:Uncharacterized protein n=1 Tax=Parasitella parasitica TaxID=35722 RepID=A0A0B7NQ06_9FUNG|nr:hypothetical protein [Parasitella parasitica]